METPMTTTNIIRLASTDKEAVHADIYAIFPDWNGERQTLRLRIDYTIIEPFTDENAIEIARMLTANDPRFDLSNPNITEP